MLEGPESYTLFPELVCIEVLKVKIDEAEGYASQLVLVLDLEKKKFIYLPTHVFEETSLGALKATTYHAIHLFGEVASLAVVIDPESGEIIEKFNLKSVFGEEPEKNVKKVLH